MTLLAAAVVAASVTAGTTVFGQAPPQATPDEFRQTVAPVLTRNCVRCHSDRQLAGKLSFEPFLDGAAAPSRIDVWQKVLDKVVAGAMPPRPMTPLSASDVAAVTGWIRRLPGITDTAGADGAMADPGRVTARRLNRAEYNNTIRDLLGVTLRPADEFPVDDSGYGFDNIGDVLSLSPMLMEKYINAARTVSRAAVFGELYPDKPGQLVVLQPKKMQDDVHAKGNETPYSMRGTFYRTYHFPVDGEYEFRWRYGNYRGRGKPVGPGRPFASASAAPADPLPSADVVQPAQPGVEGVPPARGRGAGPAPRRPLTDAERKAREDKLRDAFPPVLMTNIIENAVNSKDHTTLVAAVKAAGLVDTLQGAGPFTVFAPTNAAFAKLPAGTVETLLKPENKAMLIKILTYHVVPVNALRDAIKKMVKDDGGKHR